jgi:hypothetical protein
MDEWTETPMQAEAASGCWRYFGLESGGQSGETFSGLLPLCTIGAAEPAPPGVA